MYHSRLATDLNFSALDNNLPRYPSPQIQGGRYTYMCQNMGGPYNSSDEITVRHKLLKITSIFITQNYAIYERIKLANTLGSNDILIISDSLST